MDKKDKDKNIIKGKELNNNASDAQRYKNSLKSLIKPMTKETNEIVLELWEVENKDEFFVDRASQLLNRLTTKWQIVFNQMAEPLAKSMLNMVSKTSKTNVTKSIKAISKEFTIKTGLINKEMKAKSQAIIRENVKLIKSIPQEYYTDVEGQVMRAITTGEGVSSLKKDLMNYLRDAEDRATIIATDQVRKTYAAVNAETMKDSGFKKFIWIHSKGGQFPRKEHQEMDGNIYSLDDLPIIDSKTGETGIPGQLINCRCIMQPVLEP